MDRQICQLIMEYKIKQQMSLSRAHMLYYSAIRQIRLTKLEVNGHRAYYMAIYTEWNSHYHIPIAVVPSEFCNTLRKFSALFDKKKEIAEPSCLRIKCLEPWQLIENATEDDKPLLTLDDQLVVNGFGRTMSPDGSKISNASRYVYIIPEAIINLMGRLDRSTLDWYKYRSLWDYCRLCLL